MDTLCDFSGEQNALIFTGISFSFHLYLTSASQYIYMNKDEIPQDDGALNKLTKEVVYAVDNSGNYTTELSTGWDVKNKALDITWKDIEQRITDARQKVLNNQASPILYFMELRLMDIGIVAAYTGFWKWTIKQHMKPDTFNKLSAKKLQRYAEAFNVTPDELKTMNVHE